MEQSINHQKIRFVYKYDNAINFILEDFGKYIQEKKNDFGELYVTPDYTVYIREGDSKIDIELSEINSHKVIIINVLGVEDAQRNTLCKIRKIFEEYLERTSFRLGIDKQTGISGQRYISRFFYFPVTNGKYAEIVINYDKLLQYKISNENTYFDDQSGKKIPVIDLLKYIGEENIKIVKDWNGEDYITNVNISSFKIFEEINFGLSANINILLGNNGSGKTSILQALTLALLPIENNDAPKEFGDYIRFGQYKSEVAIHWGENEKRKLFIFPSGHPDEEEPIYPPKYLLLAYSVNLNTNREQDHTKIVNEIINGNGISYFTKSIFNENYDKLHDPLIILKYLLDYEIRQSNVNNSTIEISKIVDILLTTLNNFLGLIDENEQIQIVYYSELQRYYFKNKNFKILETHHLSEGYKDHILLLTDIIVRILAARNLLFDNPLTLLLEGNILKMSRAVILIDEFDRHLHPVWQRKLLSKFGEVFPNIQFILTTHNPFSVQSAVGANIIQLKFEEGKIIPQHSIVESKSILSIIREYFTKEFFDYDTQNLLKKLSAHLDNFYEGNTDVVNTTDFKEIVRKLYVKGDEVQSIMASQLLQLNSTLKKLNKKEFEL